jgi:ubiquinone/menaquinone biosynthesis C-methylase UbiE
MSDRDAIQLSDDAAQKYEHEFVPALFAQWPPHLVAAAHIEQGDRILDVGCGTGIFARMVAAHTGRSGRITGLDLNESMLSVARSLDPEIEWRVGDTTKLPFSDDAYDVVASQFVLMFVPDRVAALKEMWRVLAPGGRLVVAVWTESDVYSVLAEIAMNQSAEVLAASVTVPFSMGDTQELNLLFDEAGISDLSIQTIDGNGRFPSIDDFVRVEIKAWVTAETTSEALLEALLSEARYRLASYCKSDGRIVFPMNAHVISARKS